MRYYPENAQGCGSPPRSYYLSRGCRLLQASDQSEKILIPGDVVYADYAIGRFDLHGANGPQLKHSLLTLGKLEVNVLLPGHNRIVENVKPGYILETANQWAPYLT